MNTNSQTEQLLRTQNTAAYDADGELNSLYAAITGRQAFSYSPSADPVYQSYAQRYTQNGRMAMRDTMGQAAALTGGYGSSYSQSAGQQQYDEYLRSLSQVLPELYSTAYQQYSDEGENLQSAYDMALQRSESDYQRSRDETGDQRYAEKQSYDRRQDSYKSLTSLISTTGYSPTDEELNQAGLSRAQADALRNQYLMANGLLPQTGVSYNYSSAPAASKKDTYKSKAASTLSTSSVKSTGNRRSKR